MIFTKQSLNFKQENTFQIENKLLSMSHVKALKKKLAMH